MPVAFMTPNNAGKVVNSAKHVVSNFDREGGVVMPNGHPVA